MKRGAPTSEADIDGLIEGFTSTSPERRRTSSLVLQRLVADDPGGLSTALALRITAGDVEARRCAAVLLREVFTQSSGSVIPTSCVMEQVQELSRVAEGPVWIREDLGEALLEALRASLSESTLRRKSADAVATAAFRQFSCGRAWPELTATLGKLCSTGARPEMIAVLEFLEVLRDEAELAEEGLQEETSIQPMTWVYAQLAALQEESGALHTLLASALLDPDVTLAESAARIFCLTAMEQAPEELRNSFRDLAPALAQAVVRHPHETFFQTLALAVRHDPMMWGQSLGDLPCGLARAVMDSGAQPAARLAALESLMQLLEASDMSTSSSNMRDVDEGEEQSELELEIHTLTALAALLAELPSPEATEWWAEVVDGEAEDVEAGNEGDRSRAEEALLQEALDDACRLIRRGGLLCSKLHEAAVQLLQMEAWQAKHGGLLLLLRLAIPEGVMCEEPMAVQASEAAMSCFTSTSPRVRWAALEVWARLLTASCRTPADLFGQEPQPLLALCSDVYTRVRRRGLLVLLFCAQAAAHTVAAHGEKIFREVLIPRARGDDDIREACRQIAEQLTLVQGVPGGWTEEQRTSFEQELGSAVSGSYAFCEGAQWGELPTCG